MSQSPAPLNSLSPQPQPPQSLAPAILRETRAIRSLIEEAILPESPNGDGVGDDPIRSMLDVQEAILKALTDLRTSVEALHLRLDAPTRPAPVAAR